jgi:hypothetical protein
MAGERGRIIGHAGGSLSNAGSWTDQGRASVGQKGEERTAGILNTLANQPGGPSVIHDVRIPLPGVSANIDHLVISGTTVTIIDSKVWAPGFYWTVFGRTFRGFKAFPAADKRTIPMAVSAIEKHLAKAGVAAQLRTPLLVVWPSNNRASLILGFLRSPAARAVVGAAFAASAHRFVGRKPAHPDVFNALARLAR